MTDKLDNPLADEAARLYAENLPVVHAMRDEYVRAIDSFFDAVRDVAASAFEGLDILEQASRGTESGTRSWWLGSDGTDRGEQPYLWFSTRDPEIILGGQLIAYVYNDAASPEQRDLLSTAMEKAEIPVKGTIPTTKSSAHVFRLSLDWSKSEDPVEDCATVVANTLRQLSTSWEQVAGESATSTRPRP